MIRSLLLTCSTLLTLETIPTVTISAQSNGNVDYNTFVNPGNEARPHTWWHWINGNITKDGIRKDIEWVHRVGLGGVHAFDAGLASPQIVANRMIYMTPEWKQCFNSATSLLSSYGMELGTANSPGWSQAGGPWVQPQDAMKKLVWRETRIAGGKTVRMKLPEPFKTSCFFQNAKVKSDQPSQVPEYYQDIAVIAYKISDDDKTMAEMKAQVTSSNDHFTMEQLSNNDYADFAPLQIDSTTHTSYINITFPEVQNIKAISLTTDSKRDYWSSTPPYCCRSLEYSTDGNSWTKIVDIPDGGVECQTVSFPAVKARYFRVAFHEPKVDQMAALNNPGLKSDPTTQVSELVLHTVTQINHSEEKAGYYAAWDTEKCPTPNSEGTTDVIDITRYMNAQGELTWKAPAGR